MIKILKKGFTLVELLAVIVILGVIIAIIIPVTNGIINNSRQAAYDSQIELLLDQALKYSVQNNLGVENGVLKDIQFNDLISAGLIQEIPKDPITGSNLEGCIVYSWENSVNQYKFQYSKDCITVIEVNSLVSGVEFQSIIASHKATITEVVFNNNISDSYNTATLKFDFSVEKDKSVVGYIVEDTGTKTLYIEADGMITAHEQMGGNSGSFFSDFDQLITIDFNGNLDTVNVTDMSYLFYNLKVSNLDLSSFDTSNVVNMKSMFFNWSNHLITLNVTGFNTSKVLNMSTMFANTGGLENLDLSSFKFNTDINISCFAVSNFDEDKVLNNYVPTNLHSEARSDCDF